MNQSIAIDGVSTPEIPAPLDDAQDCIQDEPAAVSTDDKEKFIPVTRFAMMDRLLQPKNWKGDDYDDARRFLGYLGMWRHQEYCARLLRLKEAYFPFSPDRDTVRILEYTPIELSTMQARLVKVVSELLIQANYQLITEEDIDAFFSAQSPYELNLKVDLSEFEEVLVFCRGSDVKKQEYRSWKTLYLKKECHEIPIFQRLFLLLKLKSEEVRLKEIMEAHGVEEKKAKRILKRERKNMPSDASSEHVYLKLFKNINQSDLEMLFPNTKVEFKLLDKVKLGVTAGGGTAAGVVGSATKILAAFASANIFALVGAFVGLIGLIARQVMKFFAQRTQYMMVLAQNLYFHNLANNRGVLTLLCDRAEEEDVKEEMLLYSYLMQYEVPSNSLSQAKQAIEAYLSQEFNVSVDYDIEDALGRLTRDGLVLEEDGKLKSLAPAAGCAHLEALWKGCLETQASEQAQS